MSKIPQELKYTESHEWVKLDGNNVTLGVTDYAQNALGDIVFVELPEVGTKLEKGKPCGVVESIKSVSDIYSPVSGEVIEANEDLVNSPELCNSDPYGSWFVKVKLTSTADVNALMSATQYEQHCNHAD